MNRITPLFPAGAAGWIGGLDQPQVIPNPETARTAAQASVATAPPAGWEDAYNPLVPRGCNVRLAQGDVYA